LNCKTNGFTVSKTVSRGRHGYGNEYKLKISPEMVGPAVNQKWWEDNLEYKKKQDEIRKRIEAMKSLGGPFGKRYSRMFSGYGNL